MAPLKKCLGVDLGSNTVKVVEVAIDRKGVRVLAVGSEETGVEPSTPVEERKTAIAKALKSVLRKNKMSAKHAIFALPGQKVFIRRFRLPATTPERLERIIAFEARQQIPFPIEKTDLQWQTFPIAEEDEVEVLLVAVRHDEVRDYMSIVNKCGLKPVALSVSSFALFNSQTFLNRTPEEIAKFVEKAKSADGGKGGSLLGKLGRKKKAEEAETQEEDMGEDSFGMEEVRGFVNLGASAMDLIIAPQGKHPSPKFSRSVPAAGNDVTRAILQATEVGSFADAERIKKHQTKLMTFDFEYEEDPNLNTTACSAATQAVDRIVSELRRSLDFFITQPDGMAVDSVVLSGGQSLIPGLAAYIEEKLTIPVVLTEGVPDNHPMVWPGDSNLSEYVIALGLGLQGVGFGTVEVDFLPDDRKITRDFPYKIVGILGVLLAGSIVLSYNSGDHYAAVYRDGSGSLRSKAGANKPRLDAQKKVEDRHVEVAGNFDALREAVGQRNYWPDFLALVSEVKPADVLVLSILGNHDGFVRIRGACESQRSAADFNTALKDSIEELDSAPQLKDIREVSGQTVGIADKPRVFTFLIELKTGDKYNRLEVTPTPSPEQLQRSGGDSRMGRFGNRRGRFDP